MASGAGQAASISEPEESLSKPAVEESGTESLLKPAVEESGTDSLSEPAVRESCQESRLEDSSQESLPEPAAEGSCEESLLDSVKRDNPAVNCADHFGLKTVEVNHSKEIQVDHQEVDNFGREESYNHSRNQISVQGKISEDTQGEQTNSEVGEGVQFVLPEVSASEKCDGVDTEPVDISNFSRVERKQEVSDREGERHAADSGTSTFALSSKSPGVCSHTHLKRPPSISSLNQLAYSLGRSHHLTTTTHLLKRMADDGQLPGLLGLANTGNSCYMNAAVQALAHCTPLLLYCMDCEAFIRTSSGNGVASAFSTLVKKLWSTERPRGFYTTKPLALALNNPVFLGFGQQDAQEFLTCLLDSFHEEMKIAILEEEKKQPDEELVLSLRTFGEASHELRCKDDDNPRTHGKASNELRCKEEDSLRPHTLSHTVADVKNFSPCARKNSRKNLYVFELFGQVPYSCSPMRYQPSSEQSLHNQGATLSKGQDGSVEFGLSQEHQPSPSLSRSSAIVPSIPFEAYHMELPSWELFHVRPVQCPHGACLSCSVHTAVQKRRLKKHAGKGAEQSKSFRSRTSGFFSKTSKTPDKMEGISEKKESPGSLQQMTTNGMGETAVASCEKEDSSSSSRQVMSNGLGGEEETACGHQHLHEPRHEDDGQSDMDGTVTEGVMNNHCRSSPGADCAVDSGSVSVTTNADTAEMRALSSGDTHRRSPNMQACGDRFDNCDNEHSDHGEQDSESDSEIEPPSSCGNRHYRSVITDVFGGQCCSSVTCSECGNSSEQVEPFFNLCLPIPDRSQLQSCKEAEHSDLSHSEGEKRWTTRLWTTVKGVLSPVPLTLKDCLEGYFAEEELTGPNQYECEKCKKKVNGVRSLTLRKLPEVLCIQLKRFRHSLHSSSKIRDTVHFPLVQLDLKPFLSQSDPAEPSTYDLSAVVCHYGSVSSGHYVTYARHFLSSTWYEFNDTRVQQVSDYQVEGAEGYLLFYKKTSAILSEERAHLMRQVASATVKPDDLKCYLSRKWVHRFNTCTHPGPISNQDFICPHGGTGVLAPEEVLEMTTVASSSLWKELQQRYGGGPFITTLEPCRLCVQAREKLIRQRTYESISYQKFVTRRRERLQEGELVFLVDRSWFRQWRTFAISRDSALQPPGKLDNARLLYQLKRYGSKLPQALLPVEMPGEAFFFLYRIYGGGPAIFAVA